MKRKLAYCLIACLVSSPVLASDGLIAIPSNHSASETADRFAAIIKEKGLTLFTRIDHAANATKADLTIRPTEVILFGNPKVGTPLMQCNQAIAIDLPQKALIWQDSNDKVWLGYNDPNYLKQRHALSGCDKVIEKISGVLNKLATAATAK